MLSESTHLKNILEKHKHIANVQVVFVDIEKYSKRRTAKQIEIIDSFTNLLNESLKKTSQQYILELQSKDINLANLFANG